VVTRGRGGERSLRACQKSKLGTKLGARSWPVVAAHWQQGNQLTAAIKTCSDTCPPFRLPSFPPSLQTATSNPARLFRSKLCFTHKQTRFHSRNKHFSASTQWVLALAAAAPPAHALRVNAHANKRFLTRPLRPPVSYTTLGQKPHTRASQRMRVLIPTSNAHHAPSTR